jgi:signal peptidase
MRLVAARWLGALFLVLLAAWFVLLRPPEILNGPGGYIFVSGISMQPTMFTGDLAVLHRYGTYDVGDVIAFHTNQGTVIHRIVGGDATSGYTTQGDNRDQPDLWRPTPDQVIGRMWFHIPWIGKVLLPLQQPRAFGALVGLAIGLALVPGGKAVRRRRKGGR